MIKIQDVDYLCATARLRALEKNMLTRRDLEKMLDASSLEESFKVADGISLHTGLDYRRYEEAIADMIKSAHDLIRELSGGSDIFDIFRYKYDGHNLKAAVKAQAAGIDPLPVMSPLGIVAKERLAAQFQERKLEGLPAGMIGAAYAASERLAKSADPQQVDILLDRAVMESMRDKAEDVGFPFLCSLTRAMIDVENLRAAVRVKRMGKDLGLLRAALVEGGGLPLRRLTGTFEAEGFESLREALAITDYASSIAPLLEGLGSAPLTAFEREADNYIIGLLRSARLVAFGLEPLIAYLLAKENEGKLIRIVLASRAAGVSREKISERLRETYAQ